MYAESSVTSCICHKLEIVDYITHIWIDQCANSKLVTDTGSHATLRIHLMYSMPTFDTLSLSYNLAITYGFSESFERGLSDDILELMAIPQNEK